MEVVGSDDEAGGWEVEEECSASGVDAAGVDGVPPLQAISKRVNNATNTILVTIRFAITNPLSNIYNAICTSAFSLYYIYPPRVNRSQTFVYVLYKKSGGTIPPLLILCQRQFWAFWVLYRSA